MGSSYPGVFSSSHSIISGPSGGPVGRGSPSGRSGGPGGSGGPSGSGSPRGRSGGPSGPRGSGGSPGEALTTNKEEVNLLSVLVVIEEVLR